MRSLLDFFSLSSRKPTNLLDLEHHTSITGWSSRLEGYVKPNWLRGK